MVVPDGADIIPYTIWKNTSKVVLRLNADLKFRDVTPNASPHLVVKTSWVNYIFPDESSMSRACGIGGAYRPDIC
jgi:hypothetical protein